MNKESDYCRRRFAEELAAAESAASEKAEEAHRSMAEIYAMRLTVVETEDLTSCSS